MVFCYNYEEKWERSRERRAVGICWLICYKTKVVLSSIKGGGDDEKTMGTSMHLVNGSVANTLSKSLRFSLILD